MEKATAVNTCLGVLKGRDCIYLDQVKQDALNNLTFTGDINGHLISQRRDEKDWFPYTLTFRQVLPIHSPSGRCWPILPVNWTPMKIWLGRSIWMAVPSI